MDELPFDFELVPRHIAMIMDGNGRWAKAKGRPRVFGHKAGVESLREIVCACGDFGVEYLTVYAFSTENWNRPKTEVSALMTLLSSYLRKEVKELDKNNVRLASIGDVSRLPKKVQSELQKAKYALAGNTGLTLVIALSYGARDEITRAVRRIAEGVKRGELFPESLTEEDISSHLDSEGMPDPDLIIRTGGEMRLSNFLLWQASYAEYMALDLCWPDFNRDELAKAIADFQKRTRKYGKVIEP